MGHTGIDTNRTVTWDWSTAGLIPVGLTLSDWSTAGLIPVGLTLWDWSTVGSENEPRGGERRDRQGSHVTSRFVVSV